MLLVLSLYFCFSFVILMDKLSSESPVTQKEVAWKAKTVHEKQLSQCSPRHYLPHAPLAPRHTPLGLSALDISRTSWILRIFNKLFIFESFCRALCETLPNSWFCVLNNSYYYNCHLLLGFLLTGCLRSGSGGPPGGHRRSRPPTSDLAMRRSLREGWTLVSNYSAK